MIDIRDFVWQLQEDSYPDPLNIKNPLHADHINDVCDKFVKARLLEFVSKGNPQDSWLIPDIKDQLMAEGFSKALASYVQRELNEIQESYLQKQGGCNE